MADLNKIRGTSQIQAGTVPASAMNTEFSASDGDLFVDKEDHSSEANGYQTGFTLAAEPIPGSEHVYLRGLLRRDGYTLSGAIITFDVAPQTGDDLVFSYRKLI